MRRRRVAGLLLLGLLGLFAVADAGQNQLDSDGFGGTAGDNLPTYSGHWQNAATSEMNSCRISNPNGGVDATLCANYNNGFTWTNDQYAELKYVVVPDFLGVVCVRMGTGGTLQGYCGGINPGSVDGNYRIYSVNGSSTFTTLAGPGSAMAANDVVNIEASGTSITLRVNGSIVLGPVTDSTYTTNNPGLAQNHGTGSIKVTTNWKAGSVTATANARSRTLLGVGQ